MENTITGAYTLVLEQELPFYTLGFAIASFNEFVNELDRKVGSDNYSGFGHVILGDNENKKRVDVLYERTEGDLYKSQFDWRKKGYLIFGPGASNELYEHLREKFNAK